MDQQGKPTGTAAETDTAQTLLAEAPVPHGDEALTEGVHRIRGGSDQIN